MAVSAEHIPGKEGMPSAFLWDAGAFQLYIVGPPGPDPLGLPEQFRGNDLKLGQHFGAAFPAPKHPDIGKVFDDGPDGGMMPGLSGPRLITQVVQIGSDPLCAVALMGVFVIDQPDNGGFAFIDRKLKQLMLSLVQPATFGKVIAIGGDTSTKPSGLY